MAYIDVCDLCGKQLMPEFGDLGYKVVIKELRHSYDGYNPSVRKSRLSTCENCMVEIVKASIKNRNTS